MSPAVQSTPVSRPRLWGGRIISWLCALFLIFDGVMKVVQAAPVIEAQARLGYPASTMVGIGIVLLACTVVYLIPSTSILGAILLTGYLGGATATHVRVGDPFFFPVVFGFLIWVGLYLRDERLWTIIPLRR